MSTSILTHYKKGITLGVIGGLVISFDVPLIMLAGSDPWLMMAARGIGIGFVCWLVYFLEDSGKGKWTNTPPNPLANRRWLEVAILYGLNNVFFTLAVFLTTPAKLVFILAFNPMIAAILSWLLVGERPKLVTWLAILSTSGGVMLIVGEGLTQGTTLGDISAFACAVLLALALVRTRQSGLDMSLAPGFGGALAFCFALPIAIFYSSMPQSMSWVLANSLILVPVAGICLALAPRFIPAPQVAMFYLLETVLAPVWVWMVFNDVPGQRTIVGGVIVLATLFVHSLWQLRKPPKAVILD